MWDNFEKLYDLILLFAILGVTLGTWKLVEIVLWLGKHIHVSIC